MVIMRIITILFIILSPVIFAQQKDAEREENPCSSVQINKARADGLRSLSILEIPLYYYDAGRCMDVIQSNKVFEGIEQKQINADFTQSNRMQGWTSSFAYCTIILLATSYIDLSVSK